MTDHAKFGRSRSMDKRLEAQGNPQAGEGGIKQWSDWWTQPPIAGEAQGKPAILEPRDLDAEEHADLTTFYKSQYCKTKGTHICWLAEGAQKCEDGTTAPTYFCHQQVETGETWSLIQNPWLAHRFDSWEKCSEAIQKCRNVFGEFKPVEHGFEIEMHSLPPTAGEEQLVEVLAARCDFALKNFKEAFLTSGGVAGFCGDLARERLLPIIRTYLAREVSAAMEQAAQKLIKRGIGRIDICEHDRGWNNAAETFQGIIRRLAPLPFDKLVAEARLDEAKWWRHLVIMDDESYFAVEGDKRIAQLERTAKGGAGPQPTPQPRCNCNPITRGDGVEEHFGWCASVTQPTPQGEAPKEPTQ